MPYMRNNVRSSLSKTTNPIRNQPAGRGVVLHGADGQSICLDARQRSRHSLWMGGSGSGKTTGLEGVIRQDIEAGRGLCVLDPHGDLYERLIRFLCYREAVGCRVPEVL